MSWCDKLASTPAIGFKLSTHFAPIDILLNSLSPILDRASEEDAKNRTIEQPTKQFTAAFTNSDGFRYFVDESRISVIFNHRVKYRSVSGGPPIMEMLSTPRPFTSLIPEVSERLIEATLLLPKIESRTLNRVGIVSSTPLALEDLPPGIKRLIEYIARPWKGAVESYNISITSTLNETSFASDRCVHTLNQPEDKSELLTLQFDWQRSFKEPRIISKSNLEQATQDAEKNALKYFEELAEGNRFDEELIRSATSA